MAQPGMGMPPAGGPPGPYAGGYPPQQPPYGGPPGGMPLAGGYRPPPGVMKMQQQAHPTGLSPALLTMFVAREPLLYAAPIKKRAPGLPYTGVGAYLAAFEEPGDAPPEPPPATPKESKEEKAARKRAALREKSAALIAANTATWNPAEDLKVVGDPLKTLFVGRVSYDVSESALRREMETYGPVKSVRLVHDVATDKPRGYAFVEFHSTRDMRTAYKSGDGRKLEGRRCVVDVERGRTVPGWLPRRLGGGLGATRAGGRTQNIVVSGRDGSAAVAAYTGGGGGGGGGGGYGGGDERPRERPREPVPRGDTRPGADRERPPPRERSRERRRSRSRSRERRRRSRSRSRDKRHRDGDRSREKHRSSRRSRSRSRDRSRDRHERRKRDRDDGGASGHAEKRPRDAAPVPVVAAPADAGGELEAGELPQ